MKTIIAGSRNITDYSLLQEAIASCGFDVSEVISGGAAGIDSLGEWFANSNNLPLVIMTANWGRYGPAAGIIRNEEMAKIADSLIAVWDGKSRGTAHMIECAKKYGITVFVKVIE